MSGGGSTSTIQKSDPWSGVQPHLLDLYGMTGQALDQRLPYYPNQTYANFTPGQELGMLGGLGYAQNVVAPGAQGLQNTLQGYMRAPMDITNDPAVQNMMTANARNVTDTLTRDWLPAIGSGAVSAGQYGGSRQGIAEGLAMGDASKALANANAQTALGAYSTASGLASNAMGAYPGALQLGFAPTDYMQQVGGQYQSQYQRGIDEAMQRYSYPEQSLWDALARGSSIYSGTAGIGGTSSTTGSGPGTDPFSAALGLGSLGLGAYGAGLFGAAAAPAAGSIIGTSALGSGAAILPFLSDRRLKTNIKPVEKDSKGRQWYEFEFIDPDTYGHGKHIGVMAQEILETDPDAVLMTDSGYYAVDYGRL